MDLLARIRRFVREHDLMRSDTRVVVALSGGADSVALAHLVRELDAAGEVRAAGAAHFNHQLRATAERDERFSVGLAESVMGAVVELSCKSAGLPGWEAGVIIFFLVLPIDLVISSGVHAGLMGIRFGKGIEVWFVQRLIYLSLVAAVAFVAAIVVLIQNLG